MIIGCWTVLPSEKVWIRGAGKIRREAAKPFSGAQCQRIFKLSGEQSGADAVQLPERQGRFGESFVVVGRCAETVLKEYDGLITIFVLGDETRVKRIEQLHGLSEDEAKRLVKTKDWRRKLTTTVTAADAGEIPEIMTFRSTAAGWELGNDEDAGGYVQARMDAMQK